MSQASATSHYIGLLKTRTLAASTVVTHGFYFAHDHGTFRALSVPEADHVPPNPDERRFNKTAPVPKVFVTFDGKILGSVPVRDEFEGVSPGAAAKAIETKMKWLKAQKRPAVLLTTSRETFSDPERWAVVPRASSPVPESEIRHELADLALGCVDARGVKVAHVGADEFKVEKMYAPKGGGRVLIHVRPSTCVRWPAIAETSAFEGVHSVWLFKSGKGWVGRGSSA